MKQTPRNVEKRAHFIQQQNSSNSTNQKSKQRTKTKEKQVKIQAKPKIVQAPQVAAEELCNLSEIEIGIQYDKDVKMKTQKVGQLLKDAKNGMDVEEQGQLPNPSIPQVPQNYTTNHHKNASATITLNNTSQGKPRKLPQPRKLSTQALKLL